MILFSHIFDLKDNTLGSNSFWGGLRTLCIHSPLISKIGTFWQSILWFWQLQSAIVGTIKEMHNVQINTFNLQDLFR